MDQTTSRAMTSPSTRKGAEPRGVKRIAALTYAAFAFVLTFAFFTRFVIFLGNLPTPAEAWIAPTVDRGAAMPPFLAALWDLALVALFGLQHSVMARASFKSWWIRYVPQGLERSTYVLAACIAGFLLLLLWQPIPLVIWDVSGTALADVIWALFAAGWLILLVSAINFDIIELLGIRQAWAWSQGRDLPPPTLKASGLYRFLSHPMYVGVLLGFWMTPLLTAGHMLIAAALTAYILIAMRYEERDLKRTFGGAYASWRHAREGAQPRS